MALTPANTCDFGWQAPEFDLHGVDGKRHSLNSVAGAKGTLVMFICNHCPYVLRQLDTILHEARALQAQGIGVAAICSNDEIAYPEDSFEMMLAFAQANAFPFPYLHDESQQVAKTWDAACTPDFFGLNAAGQLQYRGRLRGPKGERELYDAMMQIAETGAGPQAQTPAMGCSIKWKTA